MQEVNSLTKRRKIGFFVTKGVWGGAQKYVYNLATSLPKEKFDVFVVTGAGDALKERLEKKEIKTYTVKKMKRDISIFSEIITIFTLLRIILKEKPDVLHLNSPKAAGLGSFIGRLLFVPKIVQTIHGFTWNEDRSALSKILIVFFTWITLIFCHKNIVLSQREKRQAENLPFVKNKIILIPNGIEKIDFKEKMLARKELLAQIGGEAREDVFIIGSIGELHKNKGYEYSLLALSRIDTKIKKDLLYFIIGTGEERDEIEKLIKKYSLENKVFLLGFLDKASEYLKAFDVFLMTSIKEGLPFVILEAGLAGLPIVSSALGGIPEVLDGGKSGILVTPKKMNEVVRALEYLITNTEKRSILGENVKKKIETDYSLEKIIEKTINLYKI